MKGGAKLKDYNVQQVSNLLKTNPETVRRWIRSGKLKAVQDSRKGGNIISEEALKQFMRETPKYAGLVASIFAPAAIAFPIAIGSLMGSLMSAIYGQKKTKVSSDDIEKYLMKETSKIDFELYEELQVKPSSKRFLEGNNISTDLFEKFYSYIISFME